MKKLKCLLVLVCVPIICLAQSAKTEKVQSINLNLLGLQYNYEYPVARKATINLHVGMANDLSYSEWSWGTESYSEWGFSIRATAGADLRYFYNLDRRSRKGKSTSKNTGNFLSVDFMYVSRALYSKNLHSTGEIMFIPNYGLRRVYRSGWLIETRIGYGIGTDGTYWGGKLKADFKIGYTF